MPRLTHRRTQAGAATLVVVMVLFFIISLVAAYTSRNLIFEQRTSANQYRSTQALEAAEAGLEWAVSMMNFGRIDANCVKSTSSADTSFRQRYLNIDPANGNITPIPSSTGAPLAATCVLTPTGWDCTCPATTVASPSPPTAPGVWPAFRVRFMTVASLPASPGVPQQPGVVRAEVVACTRLDATTGEQCLTFDGQGALNEGRVVVTSLLAITGNPVGLPVAPLTSGGAVNAAAEDPFLRVFNTEPSGLGFTVHARGNVDDTGMTLRTAPGSPINRSILRNDAALNLPSLGSFTTSDRRFATIFNMRAETFRTQQAAVRVACSGKCSAAEVRTAMLANPHRPIWLSGGLDVDSPGDIGSATEPVVLIVNGDLEFSTGTVTIHGLVYLRLPVGSSGWETDGSGTVNGAVFSEGAVEGDGTTTLIYNADVLNRVRGNVGTFVRAPGSWRDFQ